jgi:hypothetical protein
MAKTYCKVKNSINMFNLYRYYIDGTYNKYYFPFISLNIHQIQASSLLWIYLQRCQKKER